MDSIHDVIKRTETDGINGSIGGKHLKEFIIIEHVVKVYLASLFPTNLGIHDASTSIETYLLSMRYQDFLDDLKLIIQHMIDLYGVFEGYSNDAAYWMYPNSFNDLAELYLEGYAFRHHCIAPKKTLMRLVDLCCLMRVNADRDVALVCDWTVDVDGLIGSNDE